MRVPPSQAGTPLEAMAHDPAVGLRSVLRSPHGAAGEIASASSRASAPHRLWSFTYAPVLHRRALMRPPALPPLSCGPSPYGAQLLGGHPGSWPDHPPSNHILWVLVPDHLLI
ncbi:hypothetical protein NDU88_005952 [Pleurodeles waltl]|uniref:Uncharacterized protein n=1 Tax=Pleurodeles waltl TaxID=8319 RepID=A0AAV7PH25_PLEWA|nr:hypothetical protein NDU88_005952 [Pleurodeles waltl]